MVQVKTSAILSRQRAGYLAEKGFVMNHSSTKALVEFLHAYLSFLSRFGDKVDMKQNREGVEFVCEYLDDPRSQRDILTQCSIIFWMLLKLHVQAGAVPSRENPLEYLCLFLA